VTSFQSLWYVLPLTTVAPACKVLHIGCCITISPSHPPLQLTLTPPPLVEILEQARERAEQLLNCPSGARTLNESSFFDYLDDTLQAHDDDPTLAAALDDLAVQYRCVHDSEIRPVQVWNCVRCSVAHVSMSAHLTVSMCLSIVSLMHAPMRCCSVICSVGRCIPVAVVKPCHSAWRPCATSSGMSACHPSSVGVP
jgi:hypothetical protein